MRFIESTLSRASAASGTADGVPQVGDAVATDDQALGHRARSARLERLERGHGAPEEGRREVDRDLAAQTSRSTSDKHQPEPP